jgi:LMBR1 domain-containing protein 1
MNVILFNVGLILFSSFSVTQFCVASFDDYVNFTDIQLIFGVQIRYLIFFVYFYRYHVFEYAFLGIILLAWIYLIIKRDTEEIDKLEVIIFS